MERKTGPSAKELECTFRLFLRGLDDRAVLSELERAGFPRRGIGHIRDTRREFDAARRVLAERSLDEFRLPNSAAELAKHREAIKGIAARLMDEVQVPAAFDIFRPSMRRTHAQRSLPWWEATEDGKVHVYLPVEQDRAAGTLYPGLLSHLRVGDLAQTDSDIQLWKEQCERYLQMSYELLRDVHAEVETQIEMQLLQHDEARPGLTVDFPAAVCIAVVEGPGVFRAPEYDPYQHSDVLFGLRWCSITIAMARNEVDLERYGDTHQRLIERFARSPKVAETADLHADLDRLQRRIVGHLNRFCHTVPLPGHCDLCRPARAAEDAPDRPRPVE